MLFVALVRGHSYLNKRTVRDAKKYIWMLTLEYVLREERYCVGRDQYAPTDARLIGWGNTSM